MLLKSVVVQISKYTTYFIYIYYLFRLSPEADPGLNPRSGNKISNQTTMLKKNFTLKKLVFLPKK